MNNCFYITDFGAVEGQLSTNAIQQAFDEASKTQGTVIVPRGTYVTGTVNMGKASLCLERGAVLFGSGDPDDYYANGYPHNEFHKTVSLLYAMNADSIKIYGEGTIDMNGSAFFDFDRRSVPDYYPEITEEQRNECTATFSFRPTQPMFFLNCNNMSLRDITIKNAPCWTVSFNNCENVRVTDLTICNDRAIPNNDGVHFCGCRKVIVRGCSMECGDDCVALSGITDWDIPCEDVVISDCIFRSTSKAIVLGFIHSIVRNVTISNCIIRDSQRGLCIMATTPTGLVENVTVTGCQFDTHIRCGNWWGNGEPICIFALKHNNYNNLRPDPVREFPVNIRNVRMSNILCSGENIIGIVGNGSNIENITIDGLRFIRKESKNAYLKGVNTVDVSPAEETANIPDGKPDYWLHVQGVRNIAVRGADVGKLKYHSINTNNLTVN